MEQYANFIDGAWVAPSGGEYYQLCNPGNKDDALGSFPLSRAPDVDKAVTAARTAFAAWAAMLPDQRANCVYAFIDLLDKNVRKLGEVLCREQGKTLGESVGEVARGVKECRYIVGEATRLEGMSLPSERPNVTNAVVRVPIGVVAAITPWNFPVLTPIRKIIPALVAGCTVVFKPSYDTPLCGIELTRLLEQAGIPKGVVNLVIGRGSVMGDAISGHPGIAGISFTGSTAVGRRINEKAASHFAKIQLEMGGKNPALVADFSNLEFAASQICGAAFANAGQRCTAVSRVVVVESQADALEKLLAEKVAAYTIGYGMDKDAQIGPVINEKAGKDIMGYIESARREGATVAVGGNRLTGGIYDKGFYIEATLITNVTPTMTVAVDEIFGPVLVVIRVKDFAEGLRVCNDTRYGLATCVFTDRREYIFDFMQRAEAGMVHINHGSSSESFMPFGGVKDSGLGNFGIGSTNKDFFTTWKVIYTQFKP